MSMAGFTPSTTAVRTASLLFGKLDGRSVQCPAHGLRFNLASGCMRGGAMNVRAYPDEIAEGCIRITVSTPITSHL